MLVFTVFRLFNVLLEDFTLCPSTIVFGVPLAQAAASDPSGLIPSPIRLSVQRLETNNIWESDLYIASGNWITINKYKQRFNRGEVISLDEELDMDVITGIMKLYIHDIPHNLVTTELKNQFLSVTEMKEDQQLGALQELIVQLPPCNKATLALLVPHLSRVCENSNGEIKPGHLGAVFGGTYRTVFPLLIKYSKQLFTPQ